MENKNNEEKLELVFGQMESKGKTYFGGQLKDKFLFWDKKIDEGQIFVERIEGFFNFLINLVLILFGVFGLICLANNFIDFSYLDIVTRFVLNNSSREMLVFWWSLVGWAYFMYRLQHRFEIQKSAKITKLIDDPNSKKMIEISKNFDHQANKLILESWQLANSLGHEEILSEHLFISLLGVDEIKIILGRLGVGSENLRNRIMTSLSQLPKTRYKPSFSQGVKKILIQACAHAYVKKEPRVSPREIILALVTEEGIIKDIFYDLEIDIEELKNVIAWLDINHKIRQQISRFNRKASYKPKSGMDRAWTAVATPFLDQFGQDMTVLARNGYLGLCVGRDEEIDQVMRLVESGKKGILLVGLPDVGKTSIIEGIAQLMVTEDVPEPLQDKRLISLSVSSLVAGGSEIGEIEGRLRRIIFEISRAGNIVLFISNIHNMTGVTTSNGELDLSEMMAEVLSQAPFITFATTDPINNRRYIQNKSIGVNLSSLEIKEPDKNQAIQILESKVGTIEYKQGVYFSYASLDQAVDLSVRYIQDRPLPKKAADILEESAVYVRQKRGKNSVVSAEDVAEVISTKLGISATKINQSEADVLLNLEDKIHQRLIDQAPAVKAVSNALRRARTELRDIEKPITNLLFLGPTGVGKTELAKTVSTLYFGSEDKMIRLDMSEYQEAASINRLIGTPGQTGGGLLTESVHKNPYSLLLLDEIEKAHPDILNVFLQVLDDGRLTDNEGKTIDFTNLIIIATSNAGSQFIQEEINRGSSVDSIKDVLVREKLKDYFKPEFLNRFDDIIVFKTLEIHEVEEITKLFIKTLKTQMLEKGVIFEVTPGAIKELAQVGFDPAFGARPLKRAVQDKVSNALAQYLLTGKIGRRDVVVYDIGGKILVKKAQSV